MKIFGIVITLITIAIVQWLYRKKHLEVEELKSSVAKYLLKTMYIVSNLSYWSLTAAWYIDSFVYDGKPTAYVEQAKRSFVDNCMYAVLALLVIVIASAVEWKLMRCSKLNYMFWLLLLMFFCIGISYWSSNIREYYNRNIEIEKKSKITMRETNQVVFMDPSIILPGKDITEDRVPYWYLNYDGQAVYDTTPANLTKITASNEEENTIEITAWTEIIDIIDHNRGTKKTEKGKSWVSYVFRVPRRMMPNAQYKETMQLIAE